MLSQSEVNNSSLLFTEGNTVQCNTSSPFSFVVLDNESSDEDNVFTDSMTSHTTTSDSSECDSSFLPDQSLKPKVQDINSGYQYSTTNHMECY